MPTFLLTFALFMLGACAVFSSPVPAGKGKRVFLFVVGIALWAVVYVLVRTNQESLVDFLSSDWALSGKLANQVGASLVVFEFGWFTFIASSIRTERRRTTQFDQLWYSAEQPKEEIKVFRPWPSLLIWIPVVALLAGIWIVPVHLASVDIEQTANPTATTTATNMPTATSTNVPTWTPQPSSTPTVTATSTNTPTATPTVTPTAMSEPTQTSDPSKPALVCNGTWLHEEPVQLGGFRILFELCDGGQYFVTHEIGSDWGLIPLDSTSFMVSDGTRYEFELKNGELLVNGQPFADWLATQGGR